MWDGAQEVPSEEAISPAPDDNGIFVRKRRYDRYGGKRRGDSMLVVDQPRILETGILTGFLTK